MAIFLNSSNVPGAVSGAASCEADISFPAIGEGS